MEVLSLTGEVKGKVDLPDSVFGSTVKQGLVWESVRNYLANQREGNACVKTRAEVSGTGKKPYRQKHTGRARHGSRRSPIFRGGGIAFGPRPRDYSFELPKKTRRQALFAALSAKYTSGQLKVVEEFDLEQPKTKDLAQKLSAIGLKGSLVLFVQSASANLKRASHNIPWLLVMPARDVNAYTVLVHDNVVFTEQGLHSFLKAVRAI